MLVAWCSWSCDLRVCASSCNCLSCAVCVAGVPVHSLVVSLRGSVLECTSLGVLLQLVSIELEILFPWLLVLQWEVDQLSADSRLRSCSASLTTLDFQSFASLLSRRMCASNSSS